MLGLNFDKLLGFMGNSGVCEHCGVSSKTTLCSECHDELLQKFNESASLVKTEEGLAIEDSEEILEKEAV